LFPRDRNRYPLGVPIRELVGKEDFWVYAFDHREGGRLALARAKKVWETKVDTIWELAYGYVDGDGHIRRDVLRATGDHLVMLRDGSYRELKDLRPGDSLMPMGRRTIQRTGRSQVDTGTKLPPGSSSSKKTHWEPEYLFVAEKVHSLPSGSAVHHKDFNKLNDSPDNLAVMTRAEHSRLHRMLSPDGGRTLAEWNREFWSRDGEEQRKKRLVCSQRSKKLWEENYQRMYQTVVKATRDPEVNKKRSAALKGLLAGEKNPMYGIPYDKHPKGFLGRKHTEFAKRRISEKSKIVNHRRWRTGQRARDLIKTHSNIKELYEQGYSLSRLCKELGTSPLVLKRALKMLGVELRNRAEATKAAWNLVDRERLRIKKKIGFYRRAGKLKEAAKWERILEKLQTGDNHTVLSVKCTGKKEPVFDMEVEGLNNFATKGIFVHNSTRKWDSGTFARLLEESRDRGTRVYSWCVLEVLEPCPRKCHGDPRYGDCPAWDYCQGVAHHSQGYYSIDDWVGKCRLLSRDRRLLGGGCTHGCGSGQPLPQFQCDCDVCY